GGNPGGQARPRQQHDQAAGADQSVARLQAGQRLQQQRQLVEEVLWCAVQLQAEQILDLQQGDDDADAGGKTQGDRVGHELDQAPCAQQAQADENQAGEQGAQQQAANPVLLGDG